MKTDKNQFFDWYNNNFIKKFGGVLVGEKWFDKVESTHDKLREKLGGINQTFKIELENVEASCEWEDIKKFAVDIYNEIPEYFVKYNYSLSILNKPQIDIGDFKGKKIGKHISNWMDLSKISKDIRSKIGVSLADLGQLWAKSRSKKDCLYITIATSPYAFSYIGHYGPDNGSCFRQQAQNQIHKYRLGQNPNTFVALIAKEKYDDIVPNIDRQKYLGRLWGTTSKDLTIFNLFNPYLDKDYPYQANLSNCVEKVIKELLGEGGICTTGKLQTDQNIYQNNYGVSIHTKGINKEEILEQKITFDVTGIVAAKECANCRALVVDGELQDGYCAKCSAKFNICQYSGRRTTAALIKAFDSNYKQVMICPEVLTDFFTCYQTKELYHINNRGTSVFSKQIREINIRWLDTNGYKKCPYCVRYSKEEEMSINTSVLTNNKVCSTCADIKPTKIKEKSGNLYDIFYKEEKWVA